jgi:hypothetical protein
VATANERLATVEAVLLGMRDDVAEVRQEAIRTRERLHRLEGIASQFVDAQQENRKQEKDQYDRLGLRIQIMTVVVALAAVLVPTLTVLLAGK